MAKLEVIRAFVVVAKHGNLRDAADELGRTQSALSMSLRQFEQALGGPLFETDRKRDLTDLGQFVRDIGENLISENDRVQDLIYRYAKGQSGQLRIASVPSVGMLILPELILRFMESHSDAKIDLMDSDSTNVRTMVEAGNADLGIAGPAPTGQGLLAMPLFVDRLHVVCPMNSPLAQKKVPLVWQDLLDAPLIANQTLLVLKNAEARDIVANSKLSVRNIASLFAMIESGMGITVLPGLATRSLSKWLVAIPLAGHGNTRTISLLSRGDRTASPLASAFRDTLRKDFTEIVARYDLALPQ
jgi:LysR family carnitine catabolism transcriptional activator